MLVFDEFRVGGFCYSYGVWWRGVIEYFGGRRRVREGRVIWVFIGGGGFGI